MSSRLYRGGLAEAVPFTWTSAAPKPHARAGLPAAPDPDAALRVAYQKGVEAGEAAAEQRTAAKLEAALQSFAQLARELASAKQHMRREAEEPLVRLALAIARRVLNRELATDPEAILGLVRAAMDRLNAREKFKLRLAPPDAALVRQRLPQLGLPEAVEIIADAALTPGSLVVETARGELDASVTTQLDEIERGLTDVIRSRG